VRIVFLGDYTDRGAHSRDVVHHLMRGIDKGRNWVAILGNHDRLFTRFVRDGAIDDAAILSGKGWLHPALGGTATLASYGVDINDPDHELRDGAELDDVIDKARSAVPEDHIAFLESLPLMHIEDDLVFVHAGIRPGIAFDAQDPEDLLWIRKDWLDDTRDHGALVVHGHTALEKPRHYGNRVNLDGGAGYGNLLVPAVFEDGQCWTLSDAGRTKLS
jgi:serine/threonine protein phosphatase 1